MRRAKGLGGMLGTTENFVPVQGSTMRSGRITVPYSARFVKNAPNLGADVDLAGHEEVMLDAYFGVGRADQEGVGGAFPMLRAKGTGSSGTVRECHRDRVDEV